MAPVRDWRRPRRMGSAREVLAMRIEAAVDDEEGGDRRQG
jgi:hypothetical protein